VPADFRRQVRDGNHAEAFVPQHTNSEGLQLPANGERSDALLHEGKTVYETIESISKCNYPNEKFEVIAQEPAK
jgi:hypothetical protein